MRGVSRQPLLRPASGALRGRGRSCHVNELIVIVLQEAAARRACAPGSEHTAASRRWGGWGCSVLLRRREAALRRTHARADEKRAKFDLCTAPRVRDAARRAGSAHGLGKVEGVALLVRLGGGVSEPQGEVCVRGALACQRGRDPARAKGYSALHAARVCGHLRERTSFSCCVALALTRWGR